MPQDVATLLFTDITEQVGLLDFPGNSARNTVFVDYDNDGFRLTRQSTAPIFTRHAASGFSMLERASC